MTSPSAQGTLPGRVSPLPTGTVTFLFTDVEGSTRLLGQHPDAYRVAIRRHHDLLARAVQARGGEVFETVGDAVYAAFARPTDAVRAAVDGQLALRDEAWGQLGGVAVRMGVHVGEVELHEGHYFGAPLYRCARLTTAAHGGQIVLSEAIARLVPADLPGGASLHDLGEHRLKDLARPERIFQLLAPGLASDFPPLRSLDATPQNLPILATPFIGRRQQLGMVLARLLRPEVRLLTLTGPGGTGKTRLALQAAADLLEQFPDGVFFVPLASIADADLLPSAIAQALEIKETAGRSLLEMVKEFLRERALLLVLDNFEQVLDGAPIVADLLGVSARLKLLVTSRAVLHLYGEHENPVPPLALPDRRMGPTAQHVLQYEAVRLFVDRAQAARPDFVLTDAQAPALAEICHRLDGLPLAIELAATRVRTLPVPALLDRMERRLPLLAGGPRDAPARQRTLRDTIAWSYDLLSPAEQTLFRRLAVFRGCALDAVDAVCCASSVQPGSSSIAVAALGLDALDGVTSLVEKSLLLAEETPAGQPWYVMLETIREFALERLVESQEANAVHRRHVLHYLRLAETAEPELYGAQQADWLHRLEREHDNFRAALGWCEAHGYAEPAFRLAIALSWFWTVHGHVSEGRERLAALLARFRAPGGAGARAALRAHVLSAAGTLASFQGDHTVAQERLEEALRVVQAQGDTAGVYSTLMGLGLTANLRRDYPAARGFLEQALGIASDLGDTHAIGTARYNLANVLHEQGDYTAARTLLEESVPLLRETGDLPSLANSFLALGIVAHDQGDYGVASAMTEQALAVYRLHGSTRTQALALANLGRVATAQGDYQAARERLRE
ncbi:MAG: tetratricopeptide repeat protein, partial [Chloroflexota bacterium]|nr:tetratricopeptide repeat protein [Chloroflexota bacterium]